MKSLQDYIIYAPKSPGVYQFQNADGDILYVGKAKNLKSRIKSYFLKEIGRGPSIDLMVSNARKIIFKETESEIEAVILEAELIKKIKPRYNIQFKDDKSFFVIHFTKEEFPCVGLRRIKDIPHEEFAREKKAGRLFGPYPNGMELKKSLRYLRKIFPYRDCSKTKYNLQAKKCRACIYGDIRVCTAPCADWVDKKQYNKNITYLKNFLRGKKAEVEQALYKEMKELSRQKRYEVAALTRNQVAALDHLRDVALGIRDDVFDSTKVYFKRMECFDISNISGSYAVGAMSVFISGKKAPEEYRKFKIKNVNGANDIAMMAEILRRRMNNKWGDPDLVVIDGGETHLKAALKVLTESGLHAPIIAISKGPKRDKDELHFQNHDVKSYIEKTPGIKNNIVALRDEAHRFAISYYRDLHAKGMIK
jgi:excinuclease ABC subunit C